MALDFSANCDRCAALCCVAPTLMRSSDFAIDKPGGVPCPNLGPDARCGIHAQLHASGFAGCMRFHCLGAGPRLVDEVFASELEPGDVAWTADPQLAGSVRRVFAAMRGLMELLWYLDHGIGRLADGRLRRSMQASQGRLEAIATGPRLSLEHLDLDPLRGTINPLLLACSTTLRKASPGPRTDYRGADLVGRDLRSEDLRGASLRGALLLGARLDGVDLALADFTGADLRGASFRGADLSEALFLRPGQMDANATGP